MILKKRMYLQGIDLSLTASMLLWVFSMIPRSQGKSVKVGPVNRELNILQFQSTRNDLRYQALHGRMTARSSARASCSAHRVRHRPCAPSGQKSFSDRIRWRAMKVLSCTERKAWSQPSGIIIEHCTPFLCRFLEYFSHDAIGTGPKSIGKEDNHRRTRIIPPSRYGGASSMESPVETVAPIRTITKEEIQKLAWRPHRVVFAHRLRVLSM